ncbi:hypothetical protein [Neobacillus vireti]|uniref:Uncharacterized protein n=1 Tax=Neobacillus vireti LMG 21834 TaxID=1131730 RepID=A0AB94ISF9_9BACI|nr:hypothetical protein [Neobacillus vireti]ETI69893.1 hypothetical protein BAVI_05244 [Neobacillus vireti LMG 21834]KLT18163.1 hypothetical protein AA980_07375 [Neobacillus vireti]
MMNEHSLVHSGIGPCIASPDTDKPLGDTAKDLVYQQKERLEATNETEIAVPYTFEILPFDPKQLKEITIFQISTNSREISTNYE